MKPTIKTIAEKSGVSIGTVDRVLHKRPNVKPEVRERVMEVIQQLDYHPNKAARALASKDNCKRFAAVFPSWSGYFREDIQRGIAAATEELSDFSIKVESFIYDQRDYKKCIEILNSLTYPDIAGISVCAENSVLIREAIDILVDRGVPVVTFNSDLPQCKRACFVGQEPLKSGRVAAEIICKYLRADERIVVVLGNFEYSAHKARVDGFMQRLKENGISEDRVLIMECYNEYLLTYEKLYNTLHADPGYQYIYMANRSVSGCVEALRKLDLLRKIRIVCHDVTNSIVGFLKDGSVDFTIEQDLYEQGYRPLMLLADIAHDNNLPKKEFYYTSLNIINAENVDLLK